jgi:hypothetical protein
LDLKKLVLMPLARRQQQLTASRPALTELDFVNQTASNEMGRVAAGLLWKKLAERKFCDEFCPYPSDDLLRVYGLAEEDLDMDVIREIMKAVNCQIPDRETLRAIGPINTPRDVIRLVEASGTRAGDN